MSEAFRNRTNIVGSTCSTDDGEQGSYHFVGAGNGNVGGGQYTAVVTGSFNESCDLDSTIGGGGYNDIGNGGNASFSFIGAGEDNQMTSTEAFIGAGDYNGVSGNFSAVGAGEGNQVTGESAGVGAGADNTVAEDESFAGAGSHNAVNAQYSFIGAGYTNTIAASATDSVLAGGNNNYLSGVYGAIGGGSGNKAEGAFSIIPGGADNDAFGAASFAAGFHAEAAHNGSFVWSDDTSGSSLVADGAANEFVVRASGGTFVYSSENLSSGVKLAAGSGTWASLSDRNAKTHVVPLDDASILAKVAALPIAAWEYKTESGVRHVGPMAQDFYAAFGVGEDDRHITSIDEDGVALAAIKALHRENGRLASDNHSLHSENRRLRTALATLAGRTAALEQRLDALAPKTQARR